LFFAIIAEGFHTPLLLMIDIDIITLIGRYFARRFPMPAADMLLSADIIFHADYAFHYQLWPCHYADAAISLADYHYAIISHDAIAFIIDTTLFAFITS
jgi:hypothetical protein